MKNLKWVIEVFFFILGLALFGLVIKSSEPERLREIFMALHGSEWAVFGIYPFMCLWDVAAWKMVFAGPFRVRLKLPDLFAIRLAGEAVNNITPVIDIGGEPLKVVLVSRRFEIPKRKSLAAGVIGRTALLAAEIIFMVLGLFCSFFWLPLPFEWRFGTLVVIFVFAAVVWFLIFAQKKGLFVTFIRWLGFFQFDPELFKRLHIPLKEVDDDVSSFYATEKHQFHRAVLFHTIGWISGCVEMYFMFRIVGAPVSLWEALILESVLQTVRTASFFIPANLGTQEAGLAFLIQAAGYHPALGVAVSLLKRLRQIIWVAIGFAIWGLYRTFVPKEISENDATSSP